MERSDSVDRLVSFNTWLDKYLTETKATAAEIERVQKYSYSIFYAHAELKRIRETGAAFVEKCRELHVQIQELMDDTDPEGRR